MATFTTIIHLHGANKTDYETLFNRLEKEVLKSNCRIMKGIQNVDGKSEYKWRGNISIREITDLIFRSLSGAGRRFSFTISRQEQV